MIQAHRYFSTALSALLLLSSGLIAPQALATDNVASKKGLGVAERDGVGEHQLRALNVAWYYNWSPETRLQGAAHFVPMAFSAKTVEKIKAADVMLGFNEPDNAKQSNLPVDAALKLWPHLSAKAKTLGSPAVAGDAVSGDWLPLFMSANPKVDFIAVHWYKGADATKFIRDISAICQRYGKPVWVTEYAPSTAGNGAKSPDKFSQLQVTRFIQATVAWMNQEPCVQRYAWHDAKQGTSALFKPDGSLTPSGEAYAKAH